MSSSMIYLVQSCQIRDLKFHTFTMFKWFFKINAAPPNRCGNVKCKRVLFHTGTYKQNSVSLRISNRAIQDSLVYFMEFFQVSILTFSLLVNHSVIWKSIQIIRTCSMNCEISKLSTQTLIKSEVVRSLCLCTCTHAINCFSGLFSALKLPTAMQKN